MARNSPKSSLGGVSEQELSLAAKNRMQRLLWRCCKPIRYGEGSRIVTKHLPLFVGLLLLSCSAYAVDLSVFGYKLGHPINLPECKTSLIGNAKTYDLFQDETCLDEKTMYGSTSLRLLRFSHDDWPKSLNSAGLLIMESGDNFIGAQFTTHGNQDQASVFAELQAKYGRPTQSSRTIAQNAFGATFQVLHARWKFPNLSVTFDGVGDQLDEGNVIIDTPEATRVRAAWESESNRGRVL
jgi:hypothetical protein